jgi:hypothetical protein
LPHPNQRGSSQSQAPLAEHLQARNCHRSQAVSWRCAFLHVFQAASGPTALADRHRRHCVPFTLAGVAVHLRDCPFKSLSRFILSNRWLRLCQWTNDNSWADDSAISPTVVPALTA